MPRDLIETETKPDLSKPSLEGLAWLLRHPEEWPDHYEWDFSVSGIFNGYHCGCALALHRRMFNMAGIGRSCERAGMPDDQYSACFLNGQMDPRVTAAVVAGRIDDYLAGRPIRYLVAGDR